MKALPAPKFFSYEEALENLLEISLREGAPSDSTITVPVIEDMLHEICHLATLGVRTSLKFDINDFVFDEIVIAEEDGLIPSLDENEIDTVALQSLFLMGAGLVDKDFLSLYVKRQLRKGSVCTGQSDRAIRKMRSKRIQKMLPRVFRLAYEWAREAEWAARGK